jgi:glycosyltransferase involved in cell wall biosynthesis
MRVCFISPSYFPEIGGTEIAIHELGKRLVNKGCEINLITPAPDGTSRYEQESGMHIHSVFIPAEILLMNPQHYYGRLFPPPITQMSILKKVMKSNKEKEFDILHQFHVFYLGAASVFAKKVLRKPLVTSLMGWDTYDPIHPLSKFLDPYLAHIMNSSDVVVSPVERTIIHAKHQGCKKEIKIIPHGVDTMRFNVNVNGSIQRKKLGVEKDDIVVLSVQRLFQRKGMEYLVYAIPTAIRENPHMKFVIIGEGPEKAKLKELAKTLKVNERIIFLGFVSSEELPKYYAACDVFALPSLYEQFGIVLAEAMACGKPVVSTEVGAIPEVVENGKTGLLAEPKNPKQFAEALLKLASDENLRRKMGEEGRKKVEKEYDWDIIAEKYLEEYKNL